MGTNQRATIWLGLALLAAPAASAAEASSNGDAVAYGAVVGGLAGGYQNSGGVAPSGGLALQADGLVAASAWGGGSGVGAYWGGEGDAHVLGQVGSGGPGYSLSAQACTAAGAGAFILSVALGGFAGVEATWLGRDAEQFFRYGPAVPLLFRLGATGHLLLMPELGFVNRTSAQGGGPLGGTLESTDTGFTAGALGAYLSPSVTVRLALGYDGAGVLPARTQAGLNVAVPLRVAPGFTVGGDLRALSWSDGFTYGQLLLTVGFSAEVGQAP